MDAKMDYDSNYKPLSERTNPPVTPSPGTPKTEPPKIETVPYSGGTVVCQIRMPEQMRKSLQMHALKRDMNFSEVVCHFIASNEAAGKAYISVIGGSKRDAA